MIDRAVRNTFLLLICTAMTYIGYSLYRSSVKEKEQLARIKGKSGEPWDFCGTASMDYTPPIEWGNNLFKANCAACHKIDKKFIGPALRPTTQKYTVEEFEAFLLRYDSLLLAKDEKLMDLHQEWEKTIPHRYPLTKAEVSELYLWLEGSYSNTHINKL